MRRKLVETIKRRLAQEVGTIYKPRGANIRIALAFPNTYYVGMSNLGFQMVYRLLNETPGAVCERVFLPDRPDLEELERTGETLVTMESQTPVRDFDVLAFSVSYELDYLNVLRVLSLSRLDEPADERGPDQPLVIAGGPAATFNPEPLAPFVDAFIIGEAEDLIREFFEVLHQSGNREQLLESLAQIEGVYVPGFYRPTYNEDATINAIEITHGAPQRVCRRWVRNLDLYNPASAIQTPETEFSNMVLAEVARGCGRRCRFCVAGHVYLPPRARSARSVLSAVEHPSRGPRVGLLSASVFDHPSSLLICEALLERNRLFSISSTRADSLNRDIAEMLHRGGHETLTIAPEAGSERLRQVIGKGLSEQEVLNAAALAWDGGFRRLKLYFMVGLPTETTEDVGAITVMVRRIAEMFKWQRIVVSVSCFVPKPWTPFQWAAMETEKELSARVARVRQELRSERSVTVTGESAREAVLQGVLARGDRRLRGVMFSVHREGKSWRAAFRDAAVSPDFYTRRPRHRDEVFPWDHIDPGVRKTCLWREYELAMGAATSAEFMAALRPRRGVRHMSDA